MANLTVTIPDAVVPRIRKAFGSRDPTTLQRIDADMPAVLERVKSFIKSQVIEYEISEGAKTKRDEISKEVW